MKKSILFILVTMIRINSIAQIPSYIPLTGLKSWYPFNNNANDLSGFANNGVQYGSVSYGTDRFGAALSCYTGNGASGIDVPVNNFPIGNAARSISVFFKSILPYPGGYRELFANGNNSALGQRFGFITYDTMIGLEYINGNVVTHFTPDSSWHLLVGTYSGSGGSSSVKVYLDGAITSTTTLAPVTFFSTATSPIHGIGTLFLSPTYTYSWVGSLDDVGVWDRDLNPCEVYQIWKGTTSFSSTITGAPNVCVGSTIALSASPSGGTWSSSNTSIATITSGGVVTGISTGTGTISFSVTNVCGTFTATHTITINPSPTISGTTVLAIGSTSTLSDLSGGSGTWSSSNSLVATIGGSTGLVTAITTGTTTITYTLGTGCASSVIITVTAPSSCAQIITTIAGNGTVGYSGDGGPATAALLYYPWGIAVDAANNIYFTQNGNNCVRKIDASGIITTFAGTGVSGYGGDGGPATAAQMNGVAGVAIDVAGNIYISENLGSRIRKVNTAGIISTVAGTGVNGYSGDGGPATAAKINSPNEVCVDNAGNIYIPDQGNRIRKVDPSGIITTIAGTGTGGYSGDGGAATLAKLNLPNDVYVDVYGNVFFSEYNNSTIRKVNTSGIISTIVGNGTGGFSGDGGPATAALLRGPAGVDMFSGEVIISDVDNNRLRKINAAGIISTIAGTGTAGFSGDGGSPTAAKLNRPNKHAHDAAGNIYIADINNHRIRKIYSYNHPPVFTGGAKQALTICENSTANPINSLLAVNDLDIGQSETWSVLSAPAHGTLVASYSATSTGSILTPSGLSYTPTPGYSGPDTFKVQVNDCSGAVDYTLVHVTINPLPSITGTTILAIGSTSTLSDLSGGSGTWSSSNVLVATIGSSTGIVTGITAGTTTITYTTGTGCASSVMITVTTPLSSCAQIITTIAGNGTAGYSGDGGMATAARLNQPWGIKSDGSGNILFADYSNNRVRMISKTGIITTIAGNGTPGFSGDGIPATSTELNTPVGIAIDAAGNVYIGDANNNRIRKINSSGIITTIAGNGTAGFGGDGGSAILANLNHPAGIALDATGNLYVADFNNARIRKVDLSGAITTIAGTGIAGLSGDGGPATVARINNPYGVYADGSGNIYIADGSNNRVRKITSGIISTIAGGGISLGDGGLATAAQINVAIDVTTDGGGNLYISDGNNSRIRRVNSSGVITSLTGTGLAGYTGDGGPASAAEINHPGGVAVDGSGTIYIADWGNNRVRKVSGNSIAPSFTGGNSQSLTVCENSTANPINSLLAINDPDIGQSETWSVLSAPVHGTLVASYSTTSTGGILTPAGLSYTPTPGYYGSDSFIVQIVDCSGASDYTTIHVTITPLGAGTITGPAGVCVGSTIALSNAVSGGVWSSSNANATVSGGLTTGVSAGSATISYTVTGPCGSATATATITISPSPAVIAGPANVCSGATIVLSDPAIGGVWNSSNTLKATVGALTGIVTGVAMGTTTITYSTGMGCTVSNTITIYTSPSPITGSSAICIGGATNLSDGITGGAWSSSNTSIATISSGGIATGILTGTTTISYTLPGGCTATKMLSVNTSPTAITGILTVCGGNTSTLSDGISGGTWTSSNTTSATVTLSSGIVTGIAAGTSTIVYSLGAGCTVSKTVTVNSGPTPVTGSAAVCIGGTISVSDGISGGAWNSSNTTIATISSGGIISGISTGTTTISYTLPGRCMAVKIIAVNPTPTAITGASTVCVGNTTMLSDAISGGTWNSPYLAVVIGSATGIVTGISAGTATITYSLGLSCGVTKTVTVFPLSPITGTTSVCPGQTTLLSDITPGGSWNSSITATAIISISGVVTGVSAGTTTITYTLPTGCTTTAIITVNSFPPAITGSTNVCIGGTAALSDATGLGTWSSSNIAKATIGATTGIMSGIASGTATITYSTGTGCNTTTPITVNPLPAAITGVSKVCVGDMITLSDAPGGSWNSPDLTVWVDATMGIVSGVSAGTATVSYTAATGCVITKTITINPLPSAISGSSNVCIGGTTTLSDAGGGTWSTSGGSILSIGIATGIVTGKSIGMATISYTIPTGCSTTLLMTVNPLPAAITGPANVCGSRTIALSDSITGGTWSSPGYSGVVSVGWTSGVVTGITGGTAVITYTTGPGCIATKPVTVSPGVSPITGVKNLCEGGITMYVYDADTPKGIWSSTLVSITSGGMVTTSIPGAAMITYTLPAGCYTTAVFTVNPLPLSITGSNTVCTGNTVALTDSSTGGTWSPATGAIATVSGAGTVSGISAGTAVISYTLPTGCMTTDTITVYPTPSAITPISIGATNVCIGSAITFSDSLSGGTWSSSSGNATVGLGTGIVTGISAGTTMITYKTTGGCMTHKTVAVLALPGTYGITGGGSFCAGDSGAHVFLIGSAIGFNYKLYNGSVFTDSLKGTGDTLDFGLITTGGIYTVVAVNAVTGCSSNMTCTVTVTVLPLLAPAINILTAPGDTVCGGTPVTFTAIPVNGGTHPTYQWRVNGILTTDTFNNYSYTPVYADVVTALMTSNTVCATPSRAYTSVAMSVVAPVAPAIKITSDPGIRIGKGQNVTFTAKVTNGVPSLTYQWLVNKVAIAGETNATYTSNSLADNDAVSCEVTTNSICIVSATEGLQMGVSSDASPQPSQKEREMLRVFPNPNGGEFTIKGTLGSMNDEEVALEITNMVGQVVYKDKVMVKNGTINTRVQLRNTIASGMYLLNVHSGAGNRVFHIVVE